MPIQDWGVTYAEMEPYHDLFEKLFGIAGKAGNICGQDAAGRQSVRGTAAGRVSAKAAADHRGGRDLQRGAPRSSATSRFPMPAANSPDAYTNPDGMQLGQCQYCGHCERFICEANAKASPEVLLYPMLQEAQGLRDAPATRHVLDIQVRRKAKRVTGVRYIDLRDRRGVRAARRRRRAFGLHDAQHQAAADGAGSAKPYDPKTGKGVVGKNFCHQTMSGTRVFFKDRWINPFLASGASQTVIDEFNGDNFDHSGLGFLGGGYIYANVTNGRPITSRAVPPGTPKWGIDLEEGQRRLVCAHFHARRPWQLLSASRELCRSRSDLCRCLRSAAAAHDVRLSRERAQDVRTISRRRSTRSPRRRAPTSSPPTAPRKGPYDTRVYQTTHVTGGTIMGADPGTSVVSPHLQHWDAENLFVVGASVYPHNAGYNPTGPLGALALRLGDDLNDYVARPRHL